MSFFLWVVFGFVIGTVARALMPGQQSLNAVWTTLLGIGGSLLGGVLASVIFNVETGKFSPAGAIGSVLGAMALLAAAGLVNRPTRTPG